MKTEKTPLISEKNKYNSPSSEVIEYCFERIICESSNTDNYNPKDPWE